MNRIEWKTTLPNAVRIIFWLLSIVDSIIAILSLLLNIDCHFERAAIAQTLERLRLHVVVSHENQWSTVTHKRLFIAHKINEMHIVVGIYTYHYYILLFYLFNFAQWAIMFGHQNY